MEDPSFQQIAIVGAGLLGGSIGLAAKERCLCSEVVGVGRARGSLDEARRLGAIDRATTDLRAGIAKADLVILCTPVRHILSILPDVLKAVRPEALVTDVGSTKMSIVRCGEEIAAQLGKRFVGSHPMAGSEKSGVRHAKPGLFEEATCFVTRTPSTPGDAFARICEFWRSLGSRLVVSRPDRHDQLVAMISHLPHLVAVSLVRAVDSLKEDKNLIKGIIGNGFRDTTRIACGNAQMWEDICAENTGEIERMRAVFESAVSEIISAHSRDSARLTAILEEACQYRGFLDNR
jgi:prephenate dehydrogenase